MSEKPTLSQRYQIENSLGAGGMAVVYLAQDIMLERQVAVKVLRSQFSSDPAFRERFHQEAKAAANLTHPNIVTVHDFGLDEGRLFIVMEYIEGIDLKARIKLQGRLPIEEAVAIMVQSCAGVGYAHRAGIVHCDVKPHNILLTSDGRVKVTDFGIARALASIQADERVDYVWGSPQYFSPEQSVGEAPSPASDVYSLGVVMYELVTGRLPFQSDDPLECARLHREAIPVSPRSINPDVPIELERIILKVLSKEPSARYRTADQLGRVLITYSNGKASPLPVLEIPIDSDGETLGPLPVPSRNQESLAAPRVNEDFLNIDWVIVLLGLLALVAVGGLIPFWLWVYYIYNPP